MNRRLHMLLGGLFALSPLTLAIAQEAEQPQEESAEIERVQVTGSNIRGIDLEGAQPLQIIDAEEIARSGAQTVFDLLRNLGATRGGTGTFDTSTSGSRSTDTPAGQAAASLRGLGPASTLTLINGRRVAPSSFAAGTQNFVDINSIPIAAIERVEVLATGASSIYGADAVAGVINYILKDDYDGAEINLNYRDSAADSDESTKNVNIVWGGEVGSGNLTLFADLFDRNAFEASDRDFTAQPLLTSTYSYLSKLPYPNVFFGSSLDGNEIANPDCPFDLTETVFGEDICAYYDNQDVLLNSELESQSLGAIYSYDFGAIQWNTDVFFSRSKSVAVSRPSPINNEKDVGEVFTLFSSLNIYSPEQLQAWQGVSNPGDIVRSEEFKTQAGRILDGFLYSARFQDPRTVENETTSFRLVSSLTGEFDNGWMWDSGITFSQSESQQVAIAGVYNRFKYNALAHGELCSDGSIANFDGDSLNCSGGSLLPAFNPFLIGDAQNDALLQTAQEMPTRDGKSTVFGIDARINGELFAFGDDYVRAAFGFEYRKEDLEDIPSENSRADFDNDFIVDVMGFGSSLAEADRTQWGAFAEFHIPLLENLDLQLAGRYDDYNDFGSTFNPKVAFSYRPIDELIVRASWASSFRAPSLTQAGVELRTTRSRYNCSVNSLVNEFYCDNQGFEAGANTLEVGNPNLQAEESDSVSLGFAWSPTDDTSITVDYWSFDHERVVDTNMTNVMERALTDASLRHCGPVPIGELGISFDGRLCTDERFLVNGLDITSEQLSMDDIRTILNAWNASGIPREEELGLPLFRDHVIPLDNTGTQNVEGLDVFVSQEFDLWGGTFAIDFDLTHYMSFERNLPGSSVVQEQIGTFAFPENIGNLTFFWGNDDYSGSVFVRFVDGYEENLFDFRVNREISELIARGIIPDPDTPPEVSSWTTVDANFSVNFENSILRFNAENIFDRDPPIAYSRATGFDRNNHNALGTMLSVSYTHFF